MKVRNVFSIIQTDVPNFRTNPFSSPYSDTGLVELSYGNDYTFTCTAQTAPHSMVLKRTTPQDEMIVFYNSTADWSAIDSSTITIDNSEDEFLEISIDKDTEKVEMYFSTSTSGTAFLKLIDLSSSPSISMPSGCSGASFQWPNLLTSTNGTQTLAVYLSQSGIRVYCNDTLVASLFFKELGSSCETTFSSIISSTGSYPVTFDDSATSSGVTTRVNAAVKTAQASITEATFEPRGIYECFYFSVSDSTTPSAYKSLDLVIVSPVTVSLTASETNAQVSNGGSLGSTVTLTCTAQGGTSMENSLLNIMIKNLFSLRSRAPLCCTDQVTDGHFTGGVPVRHRG